MCDCDWLLGQPGHSRPVQPGGPHCVGVYLVGADLQVGRAGTAIEIQRKVVRRKDLAGSVTGVGYSRWVVPRSGCRLPGCPVRCGRSCRTDRHRRRRSARCKRLPNRAAATATFAALPPRNLPNVVTSCAARRRFEGDICRRRNARWRGHQMAAWCSMSAGRLPGVGDRLSYRECPASRGAVNTLS